MWYTLTTLLMPFSTQITSEDQLRLDAFYPVNNELKSTVIEVAINRHSYHTPYLQAMT